MFSGRERGGMAAALGANAIFGFSFMFSRMALDTASPAVLLCVRFWLASAGVCLLALFTGRSKRAPEWLGFHLKGKKLLPLLKLGILQPVAYFLCENYGIARTNATVSGVIIALIPVVAAAFGTVMLKERVTARQLFFSLLSVFGVILMINRGTGNAASLWGIVLLIGAAVSGAVFNVLSRSLSKGYTPLEQTFMMMLTGAAAFTVLALIQGADFSPVLSRAFLAPALYLGLLSSIGAFLLLNFANRCLPVVKSTAFCSLSTLLSLFAGAVFLHEPITFLALPAAICILTGVAGVQLSGAAGGGKA